MTVSQAVNRILESWRAMRPIDAVVDEGLAAGLAPEEVLEEIDRAAGPPAKAGRETP